MTALRRVFLTGANGGLGRAFARYYAAQGACLGLAARHPDALDDLLRTLPGRHFLYTADVRDAAALNAAAQDFMRQAGVPDLVIANAGVSIGVDSANAADLPVFRDVMDSNWLGTVHTFQPFITPMRAAGAGQLCAIASMAGVRGLPGSGAYSAAKAAVTTYCESLRAELHGSGIAVTAILPGYIRTPMTAHNPYVMPFLLDADEAVRRFARVIARRRPLAVIPWQMAGIRHLLRLIPSGLLARLFAQAPRKPGIRSVAGFAHPEQPAVSESVTPHE